jgi:hypothetical protein
MFQARFLLGLFLDPEDAGEIFPPNFKLALDGVFGIIF